MNIPLSPCVPENLVSRDGFSRPVPRQPAHLHTQAESGAYLRDSSRVPRRRPFMKPPYAIGSGDGFSRPVPRQPARQPAHLHTQAESGAYLRDSSRVPRRRPFMKPPYAIGSVPSLSGHATAYRWRSLPRVRQHRASKPQGSSERVLPWQVTMDVGDINPSRSRLLSI